MAKYKVLDCTLRDGAYVNEARFGEPALRGIIRKMQEAHIEVIECGWLKDAPYEKGTSYFHVPSDLENYLTEKDSSALYTVMIDWDRYDVGQLPEYDGKSIDAIRVVFPHGRHKEGIAVGEKIRQKGYKVMLQAANTLAYSDDDLIEMADALNEFMPVSVSIVDTFGAMYFDDVERIVGILDGRLDKRIQLGFHAHNNQQLAFALCIRFAGLLEGSQRGAIIDSTLSGMGRGAGNATTELVASFLNRKYHGRYDMNAIMDAIDIYMQEFHEKFTWGYSTPYFIAGLYQCHVNNIAYLLKNHRTSAQDMRNIIASLSTEERRKYDYDLLEDKYMENQNRIVDDKEAAAIIQKAIAGRTVLLIAPGRSVETERAKIREYISANDPVVIGVNAISDGYDYDWIFFINAARYDYAENARPQEFFATPRIILSNIHKEAREDELVINFYHVIKRGWEHFDNAVINCLRMLSWLKAKHVAIAGFDGFKTKYNESYADGSLPTLNPENRWDELNVEIKDMYRDFYGSDRGDMEIEFITESIFEITKEEA